MQRNISFFRIFAVTILILGYFSPFSFAQRQKTSTLLQIETLLNLEQNFDTLKQNQLSELFSQIDLSNQEFSDLIYWQDLLWKEIYHDIDDLRQLVENLTLLQKSKIPYRLGRINKKDFKQLNQKFEDLSRYVEFRFESRLSRNATKKDYLNFLIEDSNLLDGLDVSVLSVWIDFKNKVRPHYLFWNKRYLELDRKVKKSISPLKGPAKILNFDEMEFYQGFGQVQVYLRKHSSPNSADF